jgi:hypothetical protein
MKAQLRPQRLAVLLTALTALVVVVIGVTGASAAPNLVTNGDFSSSTGAFAASDFAVANASTHAKWLSNPPWSSVAGGPTGNYAKHSLTTPGSGTTDMLFQGFPLAGTGLGSGDLVELSFSYVLGDYAETTDDRFVRIYGFGPTGTWSRFAPWSVTDATVIKTESLAKANDWTSKTVTFTLPADYTALGLGFVMGFQGTATVERAQGVDSVVLKAAINPEIKVVKGTSKSYYLPGEKPVYAYAVTNPGDVPLSTVSVSDNACSPVQATLSGSYNVGDANTDSKLDTTETWAYTCEDTLLGVGAGNATISNTATAEGTYDAVKYSDTDELTLYGAEVYKVVHLYWQAGGPDNAVPYDASGVPFQVKVFKGGALVGTETIKENAPLRPWLTASTSWSFQEQAKPGYPVADGRGTVSFNTSSGYRADALINTADFDLSVVKSAPKFVGESGAVTFTYTVTNDGPAAVEPKVTDDSCTGVTYKSGDDGDHLIQPSETWVFECADTLAWHFGWTWGNPPDYTAPGEPWCDTNTATVVDKNAPDPTKAPWNNGNTIYGGDADESNDESEFTFCPWIIRKDVREYGTGADVSSGKTFTVTIKQGMTVVGTVSIKEGDAAHFWLKPGTYTFCETVVAPYIPNFECWTQAVGTAYPDWTVVNYRWNGCSHGFWKNHATVPPWPAGYPTKTVGQVFPESDYFGSTTLLAALSLQGGPGVRGAEEILLKQAVAALLNEIEFGVSFGDFNQAQLISRVNAALMSGSRGTMLSLASELDRWNNGYCAL